MYTECLPANGKRVLRRLKGIVRSHRFVMAGGTALALQIGHRVSVDLDFFSEEPFSTGFLFKEMEDAGLNPTLMLEEEGTLTTDVEGVKVSMLRYPYPFVDKKVRWEGFVLAGILDIAAMKVIAISQRGAKRDFVDLYFILQDIPFRKIAENMVNRYGPNRINPVNIGKSLVYFDDAEEDPEPLYLKKGGTGWKDVKTFFKKNVKQMVLDLQDAADTTPISPLP